MIGALWVLMNSGLLYSCSLLFNNCLTQIMLSSKQVWKNKNLFLYLMSLLFQIVCISTLYIPKLCGQPFRLVDSAISATPVADRCIKLSTQSHNLHRQTLAVEWSYWRAQWLSTWHYHRMPPFQEVCLSNFCRARPVPVNYKFCYCEVQTSRSNNGSTAKW